MDKEKFIARMGKHLQRESQRERDERKQQFSERYNKTRQYKFPDPERINMEAHFYFPKMLGQVASLSTAAMAVYPVLCVQSNFEVRDWFQLSRENMAAMAGVSPISADRALRDLQKITIDGVPLVSRKMVNEGSRRFYLHQVLFIRKSMMEAWKGRFFPFYRCLIDSGVWADLGPRAKALYLALRQTAEFDFYLYSEIEGLEVEINDFGWNSDAYRDRKWESNHQPLANLCRMANINKSNIQSAFAQLQRHRLVERIENYFMVYLKPKIKDIPTVGEYL
jgi:hypothetical protein